MPIAKTAAKDSIVIPALRARSTFGKLLNLVDKESRSLVIEKRGKRTDYSAKVSSGGSAYSLDV